VLPLFGKDVVTLGIGPHSSIKLECGLMPNVMAALPNRGGAVEAIQGKMCQNSLPSGGGRSLGAKSSGEGVIPLPIY